MERLKTFTRNGKELAVKYVATQDIKDGVVCEVYEFIDDHSKDLGIVRVEKGNKTPLQRVLLGTRTVEGYLNGRGVLTIGDTYGNKQFAFPNTEDQNEVEVAIGQTMQWSAQDNLTFYEICEPPYEDGRFQNLR